MNRTELSPVDALQATLAGEHAAIYVYGVLGARASFSRTPRLFQALDRGFRTHRLRRDQLVRMIRVHGGTPVPAEVSYVVPEPLRRPAQLERAALDLEHRLAEVYAQQVAASVGADRRWAISALDACATDQVAYRGSPEMFPGTA